MDHFESLFECTSFKLGCSAEYEPELISNADTY